MYRATPAKVVCCTIISQWREKFSIMYVFVEKHVTIVTNRVYGFCSRVATKLKQNWAESMAGISWNIRYIFIKDVSLMEKGSDQWTLTLTGVIHVIQMLSIQSYFVNWCPFIQLQIIRIQKSKFIAHTFFNSVDHSLSSGSWSKLQP